MVQTGAGSVQMLLFRADLTFLGRRFRLRVLSPQSRLPYDGLLGRDVLDSYRACFDGVGRRMELDNGSPRDGAY
jgi:hypothetical protein